jgi:hypothetical protein
MNREEIVEKLNKYCRGCSFKNHIMEISNLATCIIVVYNQNEYCPCVDCLIKPMCQNRCEVRTEYVLHKMSFDPIHRQVLDFL